MKSLILLLLFCFACQFLPAQVAINTIGASPHTSAMLDVASSHKGLLVPRMTTIGRTAIANPAEGLLVFDNDTRSFWYFDGAAW